MNGGKEDASHSFVAGLLGGYWVFGHGRGASSSVNQQIVIYVFARTVLALAKLAVQPPGPNALVGSSYGQHGGKGLLGLNEDQLLTIQSYSWPVFASLSWAGVMWLFRYYPETLQPSLRSSMTYMYVLFLFVFLFGKIVRLDKRGLTCGVSFVDTRMLRSGTGRGISWYITNRRGHDHDVYGLDVAMYLALAFVWIYTHWDCIGDVHTAITTGSNR